jgi:hypothetical protein
MFVMGLQKSSIFSFVNLNFLFIILSATSLYALEEPIKGKLDEPCRIKPLQAWTPQEKWVWNQVCEGKIADFNEAKGYGGNLDPKKPEKWPESRILRPKFLERILLHEPYRSALTHRGMWIVGAWFKERLDLSNATLVYPLKLERSIFESDVNLSFLKTSQLISLVGSKFTGPLNMDSLQVGESFYAWWRICRCGYPCCQDRRPN